MMIMMMILTVHLKGREKNKILRRKRSTRPEEPAGKVDVKLVHARACECGREEEKQPQGGKPELSKGRLN